MLTTAESLLVHSVEGLLALDEIDEVCAAIDAVLQAEGRSLYAEARNQSVHSVDGLSSEQAMRVYEPAGRLELCPLPTAAIAILSAAADRVLPQLGAIFPTGRRIESWIYLEYGSGQYITPHIDSPFDDQEPDHVKVAGISITLNNDYVGGEFFVESCGSPVLWLPQQNSYAELLKVRPDTDYAAAWFRALPRTRWRTRPSAGDAILFGTQLTHGTEPVTRGCVKKIIGFFKD
jgi:2OG-Fe(II) oxygenase superfamily